MLEVVLGLKDLLQEFQTVLTYFIVCYINGFELPLLVKAFQDVAQSSIRKPITVEHQNFDPEVLKFFR